MLKIADGTGFSTSSSEKNVVREEKKKPTGQKDDVKDCVINSTDNQTSEFIEGKNEES